MSSRRWFFLIVAKAMYTLVYDTWAPGGGDVRFITTQH
jgi:hypothetical protein